VICSYPIIIELEEETFNVMWELSTSGGVAEECFLRIPQTEYYVVDPPKPDPLEKMPNVRSHPLFISM
jgi:D-aspartate oxidase/D-amino-acid oxidase